MEQLYNGCIFLTDGFGPVAEGSNQREGRGGIILCQIHIYSILSNLAVTCSIQSGAAMPTK